LNYLMHSKFPGQSIKGQVLRAGEKMDILITLDLCKPLVPRQLYDTTPSYAIFCGLVFVILSQPYMYHQFGVDWATKAPLRLCQRVHGFAERADQEVVVLSQVLASELTAGYEAFGNLQLFRVNGVPVLNLRHLCYLLDVFTQPHVSCKPNSIQSSNERQSCESGIVRELSSVSTMNDSLPSAENEGAGATLPQCKAEEPCAESMVADNSSVITSFRNIEKDFDAVDELPYADSDGTRTALDGHSEADCQIYEQFNRESPHFYDAAEQEESLLLDCENFINFELGRHKTIVLNIKDAVEHSHSILKQHAIAHPRSSDLPNSFS